MGAGFHFAAITLTCSAASAAAALRPAAAAAAAVREAGVMRALGPRVRKPNPNRSDGSPTCPLRGAALACGKKREMELSAWRRRAFQVRRSVSILSH